MVGNKQIVDAQRLLRKLESVPVKLTNDNGDNYWQVTYDSNAYNSLIRLLTDIANTPIRESVEDSIVAYHRDRI